MTGSVCMCGLLAVKQLEKTSGGYTNGDGSDVLSHDGDHDMDDSLENDEGMMMNNGNSNGARRNKKLKY